MSYLVVFFTSLLVTIFFTPYLINFFTRVKVVDNPDGDRRINENIIPRMGGIIIYFMAMVSVISFYGDLTEVRYFVIASLVIVSLGIADDIVGVNWDKKLFFQAIAAIFLLFFLIPFFKTLTFFGISIPYPFDLFLLLVLIIGCINAVNLMDGLDGLVSGLSLLVMCVTSIMGYYYGNKLLMILSVSLMGSLIGFLKFNAYPARIFLGDTGSQSLGFFLISVALLASLDVSKTALDLTFPVILLGVPIIDTLKVIVIRSTHKKNIFLPDKSHLHHILFGMKIRHKVTVFILQGFSFLYAAAAIYYIRGPEYGGIILFILITIPFLFVDKIVNLAQQRVHSFYLRDLYAKIPEVFITLFVKFLLPIMSLVLLAVLIELIPVKSDVGNYIIMLSIAFIVLLLMYSIVNYQKNKHISEILVFVNLIMFLLYSNYSETIHNSFNLLSFATPRQLLVLIVIPIVVFFLFFRERILQKKATFLAGIDLIILVFIVLLTVSSSLLPNTQIVSINTIVFQSFLLYIFYKVIVSVKVKFQISLYYLSFIIPIIILTVLLFNR
ncbi:MAG: hypothetical protein A3K31_13770 [Ignavibacteria bacterium RIFOXYA12_FULL_35_25]|nr:MAG: hypothetical protein A2058_03835 [Ignavibacteria bacterium GWA2_36_19]OGU55779.1 MAG: hypothetical protein A2X60_13575 [Ignavibacteria bacterium GWF2_35_20]OGU84838.1 MAG: hypothetical protein A3K31_13770 [Ignavibacteria bacterium RIFOXYA12_FULL_35_25]OGU97036.1 MAG: hypothetical protein A2347_01160 [Ignavibacteria bacterium RIFOXYB12_FULL_35_14]OGV31202.1 MAG: hypothetical protein A2523_16385 [Ignavibacteria bacterium RIFOXYD12_FULL_36_8]HAB53904.1 hypothetical protein [Ignavibacteria